MTNTIAMAATVMADIHTSFFTRSSYLLYTFTSIVADTVCDTYCPSPFSRPRILRIVFGRGAAACSVSVVDTAAMVAGSRAITASTVPQNLSGAAVATLRSSAARPVKAVTQHPVRWSQSKHAAWHEFWQYGPQRPTSHPEIRESCTPVVLEPWESQDVLRIMAGRESQ